MAPTFHSVPAYSLPVGIMYVLWLVEVFNSVQFNTGADMGASWYCPSYQCVQHRTMTQVVLRDDNHGNVGPPFYLLLLSVTLSLLCVTTTNERALYIHQILLHTISYIIIVISTSRLLLYYNLIIIINSSINNNK